MAWTVTGTRRRDEMHAGWRWLFGVSLLVPVFIACGSGNSALGTDNTQVSGDDNSSSGGGSSGSLGGGGSGGASSGGFHVQEPDAHQVATMFADSACKAGFYQGTFTGSYSSNLAFGIPLTVSGNVELTLDQKGSADQTCTISVVGEGTTTESCSEVFTLSGGTITGVANQAGMIGDVGIGGFPYFCSMTGT